MTMRRVLAIDGGGIRGILPAKLLSALEFRKRKGAYEMFDLVSGTSTGGIIASGLFAMRPARVLLDLYVEHGGRIFRRNMFDKVKTGFGAWAPKYDHRELEFRLEETLGSMKLSALYPKTRPELLVPTYCIRLPYAMDLDGDGNTERAGTIIFKSWMARKDPAFDFELNAICRATSAAPTYFAAADIKSETGARYLCVDGGLYANNPAMLAYDAAHELWPQDDITVVSLGTGSAVKPILGSGKFGALQWAPHIMGPVMDGAADAVALDMNARARPRFVRAEIALHGVDENFANASADNIKALEALAEEYTTQHIDVIEKVVSE